MKYISMLILAGAILMSVACKEEDMAKAGYPAVKSSPENTGTAVSAEVPETAEEPAAEQDQPPVEVQEKDNSVNESVPAEEKPGDIALADIGEVKEEKPAVKEEKTVKAQTGSVTDDKGIVSYVEGKVRKKQVDEADWNVSVEEKAKVKSRESYRTMKKSRAELELSGLDILRLAPKTTVDLVALYEETKEGKEKTDIKLEEGDIWAQVNSSDDESEFMMDTDIAAAAITGTNFRMSKDGELTEMKVYHGEVKISNAKDKMDQLDAKSVTEFKAPQKSLAPKKISGPKKVTLEEWVFIVKNMQQITFDKSGNVVSAGEFKATDQSEKTDWVEWNKKRDRQRGLK